METRDLVVMGASAGGVEPLRRIASDLPDDFPVSVFVVLHVAASQPSALAEILDRSGPLRAVTVGDGQPIQRGRIYVAPPRLPSRALPRTGARRPGASRKPSRSGRSRSASRCVAA